MLLFNYQMSTLMVKCKFFIPVFLLKFLTMYKFQKFRSPSPKPLRATWYFFIIKMNQNRELLCFPFQYRMAVLAMSLEGQISSLDINRTVRVALVHDIGEALIGDITPHCRVSEEDKQNLEAEVENLKYISKISYNQLF